MIDPRVIGRLVVTAVFCANLALPGLAAAGAPLPRTASAQTPARAAPCEAARRRSIAFVDADIAAVTDEVLGRQLAIKFILSPDVHGTMTFQMDGMATDSQLLAAFESALAFNGAVLVRDGDHMLITTREQARSVAPVRLVDSAAAAYRPGYTILAVPLAFANASEISKLIEGVYGQGLVAYADDRLGLIVLSGTAHDLQSVAGLITSFDRDQFSQSNLLLRPLQASEPDVVATETDRILRAQGQTGVTLIPVSRLRAIVVVSRSPQLRDLTLRVIDQLDRANPDGASQLHVYRPLYSSAQDLADVLNQLFGGGAPGSQTGGGPLPSASAAPASGGGSSAAAPSEAQPEPAGATGGGTDLRMAVDKRTDTLLIWATPTRWAELSDLLKKVDLPPDQVLIEATILEVTLNDEFRFGVDMSYVTGNDTRILNTGSESGGVSAKVPGFSITYVNGDLRAAISTLAGKTQTRVVSAPKLVVLSGQTASLQVGDQVPVSTQSSQGTSVPNAPIVVNTEYRDTGIILKVTPRVRGDGRVDLELSQEVSSVAKNTSSGIDSPTIQTRKFDSKLMIDDGRVIALGGLISETRDNSNTGIPGLSQVPVLGALFGQRSKDMRRTELIILVKPTVLKGSASRTLAVDEILSQMGALRDDPAVIKVIGGY